MHVRQDFQQIFVMSLLRLEAFLSVNRLRTILHVYALYLVDGDKALMPRVLSYRNQILRILQSQNE